MWRDKSATAVQSTYTSYQQNPPPPKNGPTMWNKNNNQKSSYSLPHPGHAQSNHRWQQYDDFNSSSRTLQHSPSFQQIPQRQSHIPQQQQQQPNNRQRPVSMYDTPSNGYNFPSFMPNKNSAPIARGGVPSNKNGVVSRQSPGDLVRNSFAFRLFLFFVLYLDSRK